MELNDELMENMEPMRTTVLIGSHQKVQSQRFQEMKSVFFPLFLNL